MDQRRTKTQLKERFIRDEMRAGMSWDQGKDDWNRFRGTN